MLDVAWLVFMIRIGSIIWMPILTAKPYIVQPDYRACPLIYFEFFRASLWRPNVIVVLLHMLRGDAAP